MKRLTVGVMVAVISFDKSSEDCGVGSGRANEPVLANTSQVVNTSIARTVKTEIDCDMESLLDRRVES